VLSTTHQGRFQAQCANL